jgi:hypothetical protein
MGGVPRQGVLQSGKFRTAPTPRVKETLKTAPSPVKQALVARRFVAGAGVQAGNLLRSATAPHNSMTASERIGQRKPDPNDIPFRRSWEVSEKFPPAPGRTAATVTGWIPSATSGGGASG